MLVKRAFKDRFYPTEGQAQELPRTVGYVRLVYNRQVPVLVEATVDTLPAQRSANRENARDGYRTYVDRSDDTRPWTWV